MAWRTAVVTIVVIASLGVATVSPAAAEPVVVPATCAATAPLTPSGTITVTVPVLGDITLPYAALGQPLADALGTNALPLTLPFDVTATPSIPSGGAVDYQTGLSLDLGTGLDDAVAAIRQSLVDLGYPGVADTLEASFALDDLTLAFPHPTGTSATGLPAVTGTSPVVAVHTADALVVTVDELVVDTEGGGAALDTAIAWSVLDGGTAPPAILEQRVADPTFVLDVDIAATLPAELVQQLVPDLAFAITGDVPVTMGATGPFACDLDDAAALVAVTEVVTEQGPGPETLLRVTTTPAVPGRIVVDGTPMADWGLDWVTVEPGTHEVCFGPVTGYASPPCEQALIGEGTTATVDGTYGPLALLQVRVDPAGLPVTVHVDGAAQNRFGSYSWIGPGVHQVCWGALDGWAAPDCQEVDLAPGANEVVTGAYTEGGAGGVADPQPSGDLRVVTSPAVPAMLTVDGVDRTNWGLDWLPVATGEHEVCFGAVDGFAAPDCQTVEVTAGATTEVTGTFAPLGLLQVQVDPAGLPSHVLVDGQVRNRFGLLAWMEPGSYEVCWGPVPGYVTPACETVVVPAGGITNRTGIFPPQP